MTFMAALVLLFFFLWPYPPPPSFVCSRSFFFSLPIRQSSFQNRNDFADYKKNVHAFLVLIYFDCLVAECVCTTIVLLFEAGFQFPRMHFFVVVPVESVLTETGHQTSGREDLKLTSVRIS